MNNLKDIVKKYEDDKAYVDLSREDAIKQLYALRRKALKLVDNANKTLQKRCNYLKEINESICKIQGHNYTDWEEHDGFLDRTWYYTRECQMCGKKERVDDEPLEFKEQSLKKIRKKDV